MLTDTGQCSQDPNNNNSATALNNASQEEVNIKVVDKMLLAGKSESSQVRLSDVEKVFGETIRLEEGINRALSH